MIAVHGQAPDFTLLDQYGKPVSLREYRGTYALLVFYPCDNTFVCTRQLCNYRDNWEEFRKRGIALLGINPALPETHRQFAEQYNFPFPLLADAKSTVATQYGAAGFLGIAKRAYVLVNPKGMIAYSGRELTSLTRKSASKLLSIFDALPRENTA